MVYGYSRSILNEYGLHEMKEITLAMSPEQLRLLGQFFIEMADEMEAGAFEQCSHRHMTTMHPEWRTTHPSADVIVMPPESKVELSQE